MKKRQQRTIGAIVKIPLENGYHTYARILEYGLAFYDSRTKDELSVDDIVAKPVLFVDGIFDWVITEGYWLKIGKKLPIENHLINLMNAPAYTEDVLSGKFYIHYPDGTRKNASREEVKGMRAVTVWENLSMQERLNDYYAGKKNKWTEDIFSGQVISGMIK